MRRTLRSDELRSVRQLDLELVDLQLEASDVLRLPLGLGPLAALFQLDDLELQTHGVVFQTRIHHRLARTRGAMAQTWGKTWGGSCLRLRLRRAARASSSADSRVERMAPSTAWRVASTPLPSAWRPWSMASPALAAVAPMRSPASARAVAR